MSGDRESRRPVAGAEFNGNRWLLLLATVAVLLLWVALFSAPASAIQTGCTRSGQTVKCVYNNNEDAQFTVPPGITSVAVDAIGATGGGDTSSSCAPLCGGKGANVSGSLSVSPGEKLDFDVASNASNGGGGQGYGLNGSFAGGGSGCWGGGGASAIWQDGTSTPLAVAAGGGGNGCPAGMGGDPATQGGNADAAGAAGANAYDGRPGSVASGAIPGAGGAGGQPKHDPPTSGGRSVERVPPATSAAADGGGFGAFEAGEGGGGGGGLGGGGGGGGGGDNSAETVGGSGGGGGGGSSLVPAGGSRSLDATRTPGITISFVSNLTFTSPAPPTATIGSIYDYKYAVVGDTEITYSVSAGSLPPGLTLGQTGELEGVPEHRRDVRLHRRGIGWLRHRHTTGYDRRHGRQDVTAGRPRCREDRQRVFGLGRGPDQAAQWQLCRARKRDEIGAAGIDGRRKQGGRQDRDERPHPKEEDEANTELGQAKVELECLDRHVQCRHLLDRAGPRAHQAEAPRLGEGEGDAGQAENGQARRREGRMPTYRNSREREWSGPSTVSPRATIRSSAHRA